MKKRSLIKSIALLTASVFSLTYFFLIPFARINASHAQNPDVPQPTRTPNVEKRISKVYIPTGASSTFMKTSEGEENLLIQDHITSTRIIESNKGEEKQGYYPYGMTNGEANTISDKQFTSHRSLADTGVYHAGARFYNPQLGVFVSADKVQGPNRYMYAGANPTLYTDPSGKIVPIIIAAILIGGAFGAGFGAGYEHGSQVAQYGSVKEPTKILLAGAGGAVVGGATGVTVAGVGYLGAVALPSAIGAVGTGVSASSSVGLLGGAQIGVGACLSNPACVDAIEAGAQIATGSDLPPGYSANVFSQFSNGDELVDNAGLTLARHMNEIWLSPVDPPSSGLDPRYFTSAGEPSDALMGVRSKLLGLIGEHVDPNDINGVFVVGSNRAGAVNDNSDIDILVYTSRTHLDRGYDDNNGISGRFLALQRAMNPQIQSDEEWTQFYLQNVIDNPQYSFHKRDLIDMFVSPNLAGRDGKADVFDLLNNRWGKVIYPTERTLILPRPQPKCN